MDLENGIAAVHPHAVREQHALFGDTALRPENAFPVHGELVNAVPTA
jgi:hypothetical protein